ncbi:MAG TPA: tetratricopeptide repeat protein [Polyangiaceae bacterium]|nr:tetratricopeptide repeat protein [Polyangiaceae bacterium]
MSPHSAISANGAAGLPSPARPGFGGVGLPSVAAGLPELSRGAAAPGPARGSVELPSLAGRGRASSAGFELDDGLPLVGGNLPTLGGVGLPERSHAGLPSLGAGLPVYQSSGLPSPSSGPPALGGSASSSSPPRFDALDFDIERAPSLPPDFGLDPVQSPNPRASRADFGELELPLGGAPSLPPAAAGYSAEAEEADLFGDVAPHAPVRKSPPARAAAEAIVRQSGGGTAYGEVNLGDEGGEAEVPLEAGPPAGRRDEDMEFGAIPQEDQPRAALGTAAPAHVTAPIGRASPELRKRKRKLDLRLYGGLLVVFVAGASLALVPSVGPFGAYLVIDQLKAGEYAKLIESTVTHAQKEMARDTYPEAKRAILTVEASRASAKRVRQLPAYAAFSAFAEELRFGSDPAIHARGSVLLDELAKYPDTPYVAHARAARAAAEGQIARAKQLFDGLPQPAAGDSDQAFLHGEIALRAGDPKAAVAAWQQAVRVQKSPRSAFGLARANYAAADTAAAAAAAREALAHNPEHVGARILLARISSAARSGEAEALRLLGSIAKSPAAASPDELVDAQTLLGDIHLARSRMTQAEAAYTDALKINPKAARALNGLGDALYRAGRFSEAQARFEASTQADPGDISAKIGVAKAKLSLERVDDASADLKKLRETYPTSVPVAYWFGRAQEAAGNRAVAETVYLGVLKAASSDPQAVDVYIALALLQSQQGRNDEAQKTLADARAKLPDMPGIHKALGDVALSQGRYAQATTEFRQALALDSEDLGARFRLGVALRRDSKFEQAAKAFDDVAAVDKEYPGLALERGLLFETSGRTEEALKEYEMALLKAPKDPDLMLRVGCGKVSAGRAKQAEELLRKVLSERPNSAESNHCLGRALLLEGTRLAEALRLLERAVELDANRAEYQLYAGWAANDAGNVPKAERALAEALRLDQGLADAYWQRGVLRQRQGAARDAIADLTRALELRPSRHEAHASLADAYYDLGKEPQALREWLQAIQAQPDNPTWRFRYGKLLAANHQTEGSREQLSRALELAASEEPAPRWSWEAHYLLAHTIGPKPEAVKHWQEFLRLGPRDSPYRAEGMAVLEKLGHPWSGG